MHQLVVVLAQVFPLLPPGRPSSSVLTLYGQITLILELATAQRYSSLDLKSEEDWVMGGAISRDGVRLE